MVAKNQVSNSKQSTKRASDFLTNVASVSLLAAAFRKIQGSIVDAWDVTELQMVVFNYDSRVVQTAFAQFLVANVTQKVFENIEGILPGVNADLVPNSTRSAHHVVVNPPGMLVTVSAVQHRTEAPRSAIFRETYASQQMTFGINTTSAFQSLPPPSISSFSCRYFQVRHGPQARSQKLGFIVVVPIDGFGDPAVAATGH